MLRIFRRPWFGCLSERPPQVGDRFLLRHHAETVTAIVREIEYRIDVHRFSREATETLRLNDITLVRIRTARPLVCDAYNHNRKTGRFILVQENAFDTVAAGMLHALPAEQALTSDVRFVSSETTPPYPGQRRWRLAWRASCLPAK